jgi:hypothetical protein
VASVLLIVGATSTFSGIEAKRPAPLIGARGDARVHADMADADVAAVDVPSLLVLVVGAAAEEAWLISSGCGGQSTN